MSTTLEVVQYASNHVGRDQIVSPILFTVVHVTIEDLRHPREQCDAAIAEHAMQKQLPGLVFAFQLRCLEFTNLGEPETTTVKQVNQVNSAFTSCKVAADCDSVSSR